MADFARHTSLNSSYCGECIKPVWVCYAFGSIKSTLTFLKVGENDSDLIFFWDRSFIMTHKLRGVVGRDLGRYEDGSQWFWCKLNSSHQNPTDYNIWSYSTQMPIMILNVSKWLKYISRYILSESWYLFYKCLDYSWCRQNTKKQKRKAFIGLVCTFYSTLGGMKAVLMTDLFHVIQTTDIQEVKSLTCYS